MGLTKPRAYQIFDIDYKQAVRVITLTNVTLSGGAPSTVDGVSLGLGSRILVAGQSTGSQNGVYQVSVLGTGSNGTWIRSIDTNESGELNAGTIVMVTEGTEYKDTQWKLITNDPITIGVTALVFEQNSAFAFGNIYANSTAVLADVVGDTVTFTPANNMVILANATSDTVTFAVSQSPSFTGNVSGGNISTAGQVTAAANVTGANLITTGLGSFGTTVSATGNVTGGNLTSNANISGSNLYLSSLTANRVVFANTNGQLITTQNFTYDGVTANIQGALIVDNVELDSNSVSSTVGNLSLETPAGSFVSIPGNILISGDITGNLLPSANITYNLGSPTRRWNDIYLANSTIYLGNSQISANATSLILTTPQGSQVAFSGTTANISAGTITATGNANVGNLGTAGQITATGNITGGNLTTAGLTSTATLSASGNANVGNLGTAGLIVATGNVNAGGFSTAGNVTGSYFLGNVACASGIFTTKIFNGTSEANMVSSGGNMAISIGGTSNVMVVSTGGANISGTLGATGNITGGNLSGTLLTGTLATAAQPNVTSVGTLTSLTASGNVSGGNLVTTGTVSTGTLTASGNVTIAGNLTVSGNVISVNVTNLNVVDPIIGLGRGANNTPLTSNDGKDRGQELWYYTTTEQAAFMGYDNSAGKLIAATNVSVSNDVVTVNNYGNLIVGGLESTTISATGNANVGNLGATTVTATTLTGTISTAAQTNITSVGTLTSLAVTGNVTSGNFVGTLNGSGANVSSISADNISSGTLAQARLANAAVTLGSTALTLGATVTTVAGLTSVTSTTFVGDLTGAATTAGTVTTSAQPNITSVGTLTSLGVTGNITSGNLSGTLITGTLTTAAQPNISSLGTLTSLTASGNVTGGNLTTGAQVVATGNITGGNLITSGVLSVTGNANVGNLGASTIVATTLTGTLNTAAQPNITSLGTLTSLAVTGNVTGGNLTTGSQVIATGNVSGGNITTAGRVDATGNITGGNLVTTGQLVATGNVTGALIKASSNVEIQNRGILFLNDSDNSNYIGLRSPATLTGNFTYIFPSGYGNAAQVLTTNGAGGLTWEDQSGGGGGGGATSFPNSTVQPVPGSTGNFDLSYNFVQTVQETPFESSATDPFGVNLGEVYSMMDPVGEVLEGVDLGVLT